MFPLFTSSTVGTALPVGYMALDEKLMNMEREYKKLKFSIHTWENWNNIRLVAELDSETIKEAFAEHLEDLYFELGCYWSYVSRV